jgi:hypothetical protein
MAERTITNILNLCLEAVYLRYAASVICREKQDNRLSSRGKTRFRLTSESTPKILISKSAFLVVKVFFPHLLQ